jgi:hypothetical protein
VLSGELRRLAALAVKARGELEDQSTDVETQAARLAQSRRQHSSQRLTLARFLSLFATPRSAAIALDDCPDVTA